MGAEQYLHTGDTVSLVLDTIKGDLSFYMKGVNYGVAFKGIPLDKPLAPCVILYCFEDSVELDPTEVREIVDDSVPVISNITTKSDSYGTITVNFDSARGASFYQAKVDESNIMSSSTETELVLEGLETGIPYNVRVRAVIGNSVGPWSEPIRELHKR